MEVLGLRGGGRRGGLEGMTLKGWVRGEKTSTVGVAQHVGGDGVVMRQWERQSRSRHRVGAVIDVSESLDLQSLGHL